MRHLKKAFFKLSLLIILIAISCKKDAKFSYNRIVIYANSNSVSVKTGDTVRFLVSAAGTGLTKIRLAGTINPIIKDSIFKFALDTFSGTFQYISTYNLPGYLNEKVNFTVYDNSGNSKTIVQNFLLKGDLNKSRQTLLLPPPSKDSLSASFYSILRDTVFSERYGDTTSSIVSQANLVFYGIDSAMQVKGFLSGPKDIPASILPLVLWNSKQSANFKILPGIAATAFDSIKTLSNFNYYYNLGVGSGAAVIDITNAKGALIAILTQDNQRAILRVNDLNTNSDPTKDFINFDILSITP